MKRKYHPIRISQEAFENLRKKNEVIKSIARQEKINKRITYADTLKFLSGKQIMIYNDEVKNFYANSKTNKRRSTLI